MDLPQMSLFTLEYVASRLGLAGAIIGEKLYPTDSYYDACVSSSAMGNRTLVVDPVMSSMRVSGLIDTPLTCSESKEIATGEIMIRYPWRGREHLPRGIAYDTAMVYGPGILIGLTALSDRRIFMIVLGFNLYEFARRWIYARRTARKNIEKQQS